MVKKSLLSPERQFELRQILQMATLEALIDTRRWQSGDLIFQGGTSLHLAYGSPRFSEDLDFMIRSSIQPESIVEGVKQRLSNGRWVPNDLSVSVKGGKVDNNPFAFVVTLGAENIIGAVHLKVELFSVADKDVDTLSVRVAQMQSSSSAAQLVGPMVHMQTLDEKEIYADKVFAIGGRSYIKARDMFDVFWLQEQCRQRREPLYSFNQGHLEQRLSIYSKQDPVKWLKNAISRQQALPGLQSKLVQDLAQWLPAQFHLPGDLMVKDSVAALTDGIEVMRRYLGGRNGQSESVGEQKSAVEPAQQYECECEETPGRTPC
ncbi:MAG: nucleotidyl transferase AbiEii/AbiGii toxin family protein [Herbaspirillum sp.]